MKHIIVLLVTAFCWARPVNEAQADVDPLAKPSSSAARDHLASGNKLYAIREFDSAIAAYKAGALIEDAPVFQYNLGQAYRLAGKYQEALWHYDRFVRRTNPTGALKESIEQLTAQMKAELEKAATKQPPVEAASGQPSMATEASALPQPPPPREAHQSPNERWRWVAAGSGTLVLGGAAMAFSIWGDRTYDRAKESTVQSDRDNLESSANSRRYVAQGLGIAALGCAGGAVYLYFRSSGRKSDAPSALTPVVSPQLVGLAVTGLW
jgi:tetratricopeptide (TPR) repeat protein